MPILPDGIADERCFTCLLLGVYNVKLLQQITVSCTRNKKRYLKSLVIVVDGALMNYV